VPVEVIRVETWDGAEAVGGGHPINRRLFAKGEISACPNARAARPRAATTWSDSERAIQPLARDDAATSFYENVSPNLPKGRELRPDEKAEKVVIEFKPQPENVMRVARSRSVMKASQRFDVYLDTWLKVSDTRTGMRGSRATARG